MIPIARPPCPVAFTLVHSVGAPPAATSADTAATREVIAEGNAAIGKDSIAAARKAAVAQALRNAVQQAAGVYIDAQTLTQNYRLVRDQIVLHAEGVATPDMVLREVVAAGEMRVTVRVRVSTSALARAIRSLRLANLGRLYLSIDGAGVTSFANFANFDLKPIEMTLEKTLSDAGFVMVSSVTDADISVKLLEVYSPAKPAPVKMIGTNHAQLTATATWTQTGEVIASLATKASIDGVPQEPAFSLVRDAMTANLAPRLKDSLIRIVSSDTVHVRIEAGKFDGRAQVTQFAKALASCAGVSDIQSLADENGNGIWQCTIRGDKETDVALALQLAPAFHAFHLTVLTATPFRIVASTNGVAPSFSTQPGQLFANPDTESVTVATPDKFR